MGGLQSALGHRRGRGRCAGEAEKGWREGRTGTEVEGGRARKGGKERATWRVQTRRARPVEYFARAPPVVPSGGGGGGRAGAGSRGAGGGVHDRG